MTPREDSREADSSRTVRLSPGILIDRPVPVEDRPGTSRRPVARIRLKAPYIDVADLPVPQKNLPRGSLLYSEESQLTTRSAIVPTPVVAQRYLGKSLGFGQCAHVDFH